MRHDGTRSASVAVLAALLAASAALGRGGAAPTAPSEPGTPAPADETPAAGARAATREDELRAMAEDVEVMRRLLAETLAGLYRTPGTGSASGGRYHLHGMFQGMFHAMRLGESTVATDPERERLLQFLVEQQQGGSAYTPGAGKGSDEYRKRVAALYALLTARSADVGSGVRQPARAHAPCEVIGAYLPETGAVYQVRLPVPRKAAPKPPPQPAKPKPDRWQQMRRQIGGAPGKAVSERPEATGEAGGKPILLSSSITTGAFAPGTGAAEGAAAPAPSPPAVAPPAAPAKGPARGTSAAPTTKSPQGASSSIRVRLSPTIRQQTVWSSIGYWPLPTRRQVVDAILKLLAEHGHKFRHLSAGEEIVVAVSFANPPPSLVSTTGGGVSTRAAPRAYGSATNYGGVRDDMEYDSEAANGETRTSNISSSLGAWRSAGDLHMKQRAYAKALEAYRKALGYDPGKTSRAPTREQRALYQQLVQVYVAMGKYDQAKSLLDLLAKEAMPGAARVASAPPPARLPQQLVVSVAKSDADALAAGDIDQAAFRRRAKVSFHDPNPKPAKPAAAKPKAEYDSPHKPVLRLKASSTPAPPRTTRY